MPSKRWTPATDEICHCQVFLILMFFFCLFVQSSSLKLIAPFYGKVLANFSWQVIWQVIRLLWLSISYRLPTTDSRDTNFEAKRSPDSNVYVAPGTHRSHSLVAASARQVYDAGRTSIPRLSVFSNPST